MKSEPLTTKSPKADFDVNQFLEEISQETIGLSGQEKAAYIRGKLATVPEDFKILSTALLDFAKDKEEQVLVLIHGIRTPGVWQTDLEYLVRQRLPDVSVVSVRYGFFDVVRFLVPVSRGGPINRAKREIRVARDRSRNGRISVIAHSFGTYVISKILMKEPDIRVHRLVTCGSIIPAHFRWDLLPGNLAENVVNDVGCNDYLPVMAKSSTVGFGPSGFYGFGAARVHDRFHDLGHSGFFSEDFMSTYWIPLLQDGTIVGSEFKRKSPSIVWALLSLFSLSIWVYSGIAVGIVFAIFGWIFST